MPKHTESVVMTEGKERDEENTDQKELVAERSASYYLTTRSDTKRVLLRPCLSLTALLSSVPRARSFGYDPAVKAERSSLVV